MNRVIPESSDLPLSNPVSVNNSRATTPNTNASTKRKLPFLEAQRQRYEAQKQTKEKIITEIHEDITSSRLNTHYRLKIFLSTLCCVVSALLGIMVILYALGLFSCMKMKCS